jgi:hypothetical protein
MNRTKCGMCDWNVSNVSKDTIPIATTGIVYKERGNPPIELRDVTGRLSLEKLLYPLSFNMVVTVSGIDPDVETVTKFVAKFPTKTCPKCGKALWKPKF